jgi:hypothetical protein
LQCQTRRLAIARTPGIDSGRDPRRLRRTAGAPLHDAAPRPGMTSLRCAYERHLSDAAMQIDDRRPPAEILATGPELRIPTAAAQTRIVSVARIRMDSRKSVRLFSGIICAKANTGQGVLVMAVRLL